MNRSVRISFLAVTAMVAALLFALVPAAAAADEREQHNSITIASDQEFDGDHGVRSGAGTAADPYVISGWQISRLHIADTDKYVVVRDNEITSTLVLNWNGDRVTIVDNVINDLRVNQNVERTGDPTSGLIARNKIGVVGQLRHFDGVFERNTVGSPDDMELPFFANRAVNFDGFNGARFRNNTIYGYMDVRLHGHHHGSGYGATSHDHSTTHDHADHSEHADHDMEGVDHTSRFHEVWVTGNTIYAQYYYALGYNDQGHAGNDRTAASEQNEELNKPHVHHTRVHLNNNTLIGSGLEVSIFNAKDELHEEWARGYLEIRNNEITVSREDNDLFEGRDGIALWDARWLDLRIQGNTVKGEYTNDDLLGMDFDRGIMLDGVHKGAVFMFDNVVESFNVGIAAYRFSATDWWLEGNTVRSVGTEMETDETAKPRD